MVVLEEGPSAITITTELGTKERSGFPTRSSQSKSTATGIRLMLKQSLTKMDGMSSATCLQPPAVSTIPQPNASPTGAQQGSLFWPVRRRQSSLLPSGVVLNAVSLLLPMVTVEILSASVLSAPLVSLLMVPMTATVFARTRTLAIPLPIISPLLATVFASLSPALLERSRTLIPALASAKLVALMVRSRTNLLVLVLALTHAPPVKYKTPIALAVALMAPTAVTIASPLVSRNALLLLNLETAAEQLLTLPHVSRGVLPARREFTILLPTKPPLLLKPAMAQFPLESATSTSNLRPVATARLSGLVAPGSLDPPRSTLAGRTKVLKHFAAPRLTLDQAAQDVLLIRSLSVET